MFNSTVDHGSCDDNALLSFLPTVPRGGTMDLQRDFFFSSFFTTLILFTHSSQRWSHGSSEGLFLLLLFLHTTRFWWGGYCIVDCGSCADDALLLKVTLTFQEQGRLLTFYYGNTRSILGYFVYPGIFSTSDTKIHSTHCTARIGCHFTIL